MRTDHRSHVSLPSRTVMRREACHGSRPAEKLYVGHADEHGTWSVYAGGELLMITARPSSERLMATAMLADAFPGRNVREDLVEAFVAAWTPPDGGFVLPADLVAGWSLRWSLDQ